VTVRSDVGREAAPGLPLRSVGQAVGLALVLGTLASALLWLLAPVLTPPGGMPRPEPWLAAVFVLLAALGELVSVRVRTGTTTQDLTFLEAVLVAGVLTLPPMVVLVTGLGGLVVASLVQRRDVPKTLFNLGSYAASTAAMILVYYRLASGAEWSDWRSVLALIVATLTFAVINTALLSVVLHVAAGVPPREFVRDEWRLSGFMALGGVGVGMTAVLLAREAPALLPFSALPALALWYAYGASAQHAEAQVRNQWLVTLGGALAEHGRGTTTLSDATEAIRQIVGAPEARILGPLADEDFDDARSEQMLASVWADPGPRDLTEDELPDGWRTGVVTRLDLGTANPGALLLGSTSPYRHSRIAGRTRGWALDDADAPVLGALVAAVGSAMRAGAAFDALAEETAKLSAVVDNTSDGIAMVDDTGRVRLWSQTMARMTGVDQAQLQGGLESLPDVVRTLVVSSQSADSTPGAPAAQVHLVRADGEELDVAVSTVWVREAAASEATDSTGWVSILTVHDETRERRVERLKTDFVATISHELRTPITPIKGYARLLATRGDRVNPEKRAQALQVISDRADHLSRLVDDLLLASHVSDNTRLGIEMEVQDLGTVVRQAVAGFPQMSTRIVVELPEEPVLVQCDRIRAVQCLANLIGNAEKYSPAHSTVEVLVESAGLQARVHVRDHGSGIPESERDKVFDRFYRREDPFTMRTGGAGLGLHIARELAIAMGGGLTLQSPDTGAGAEFVLHLATAEAPPVAGTPAQVAVPADRAAAPTDATGRGHGSADAPGPRARPVDGPDTTAPDPALTRAPAEGGKMGPRHEGKTAT
jgi:PAS domain S-box-containing protein